jgi:hypothetical protein
VWQYCSVDDPEVQSMRGDMASAGVRVYDANLRTEPSVRSLGKLSRVPSTLAPFALSPYLLFSTPFFSFLALVQLPLPLFPFPFPFSPFTSLIMPILTLFSYPLLPSCHPSASNLPSLYPSIPRSSLHPFIASFLTLT